MVREDGGNVRLVWRLVGREARVTINAVHSLLRRSYIIRSKAGEFFIQRSHHLQHGGFDQCFILFFAWLEPLAAIVAFKRAEERKSVRRKAGEFRSHEFIELPSESWLENCG